MATEGETTPPVAGAEGFSKEYVEQLKSQLAKKDEEAAKLRAFKSTHDEKQRAVISKLQPDINEFVSALTAANADYATEMQPIVEWGKSCHESAALESAMPLARVLSCASAQFKRTREEASVLTDKANTLSSTMKELEEIKADRDSKAARISELEGLCNERQLAAEKMQDELARAGIIKDKFDFSKISSREVKADPAVDASKAPASVSDGLVASTSQASRGAMIEDSLMSFVSRAKSSVSSNRIGQSNTSHAFLGASSGGLEGEIASAIRQSF